MGRRLDSFIFGWPCPMLEAHLRGKVALEYIFLLMHKGEDRIPPRLQQNSKRGRKMKKKKNVEWKVRRVLMELVSSGWNDDSDNVQWSSGPRITPSTENFVLEDILGKF
ncbi:hypothetical protein JTE90_000301 [Oedothorax gibbosus]|uniref:Uncharacterized protein n=1 Tax=Oedothorax gibbosus TaxID=931172 RepID=A0AAV6VTS3_9ARAC|nr:hypothetical protein JTE90_000301 [Oedothorax gibbosus]